VPVIPRLYLCTNECHLADPVHVYVLVFVHYGHGRDRQYGHAVVAQLDGAGHVDVHCSERGKLRISSMRSRWILYSIPSIIAILGGALRSDLDVHGVSVVGGTVRDVVPDGFEIVDGVHWNDGLHPGERTEHSLHHIAAIGPDPERRLAVFGAGSIRSTETTRSAKCEIGEDDGIREAQLLMKLGFV